MSLFRHKSPKISQSLLCTGDIFVEYKGKKSKGDYKFVDNRNSFDFVNVGIISIEQTQVINAIYFDKKEGWITISPIESVLSQYHIFRTNVSHTIDPNLPLSKAMALVASYMANGTEYAALKEKYKSKLWEGILFHNALTPRPRLNLGSYTATHLTQNTTVPDIENYMDNYFRQPFTSKLPEIKWVIYVIECACTLLGINASSILGKLYQGNGTVPPLIKELGKSQFFTEFKNIGA